jgi:serine/threonine protein kinase
MLDSEGRVKILDFGLAKYTQPLSGVSDDADAESIHTVPGMLMGTTAYTSPEQVRGLLEREPEPLVEEGSGVPNELQRIVGKALRKDREKRYQTSKDLALDLESLRREMEAEAVREAPRRLTRPHGSRRPPPPVRPVTRERQHSCSRPCCFRPRRQSSARGHGAPQTL